MNYSVNINGIDVNASYSDDNVEEIFVPLLQRLTDLQKQKNGRIVVFLAAPPGAGKSTLEGNYLLLDEEGWRDLKPYADYSIRITADKGFLRERLIDRKIKSGNTEEKAEAFVDASDMVNVTKCLENSADADLNLLLNTNGEYCRYTFQ